MQVLPLLFMSSRSLWHPVVSESSASYRMFPATDPTSPGRLTWLGIARTFHSFHAFVMADPMTAKDPLLLDQQLCFSLYSASLAMTQLYKPLLESMGLTFPQYLIMLVLWEHDGLTLKELSNRLRQDSGALTPVVKRLEAAGLVTRRRSAEDERNLSIELTPAGRTLRDQANGVNSRVRQVCALGDAGLDDLRETLVMLRTRLDEEGNPTS